MIIDSHAHVDVEPAYGMYDTPEKLIRKMDEAGIDIAAVSGYRNFPGHSPDGDKYVLEAINEFPDRLIGYTRINPWWGDAAIDVLEEAILHKGMRGLKLHPATYMLYPFDALTIELVNRAGELGAPVLIHSGDENMCLPYQIDPLAAQCPDTTIILAHIGGFFSHNAAIDVAERRTNVFVDTSEIPFPDHIRLAVDRLGAEKVLFGTDAPCCDMRLELKKVDLADLTPDDYQKVLYRNYASLMDIPIPGDQIAGR